MSDGVRAGTPRRMHPANLALRFALELGALASFAWWAAVGAGGGSPGFLAAAVAVIAAAAVWGTFAVPGDPSRSGRAPVPVSGRVRLLIETVVFGAGVLGPAVLGAPVLATVFATALILHHALSADRVRWLWRT